MSARAVLVLCAAMAASGCASSSFFAGPRDYAAYRATRVERTLEGRLAAADRYLRDYPSGAFAPEVRSYFERAEPVYYGAKQGSLAGLEAYLRALPDGPHGVEARRRLDEQRAARDAREENKVGLDITARIDRAAAERLRVREELAGWLGRFLDASVWRTPLQQAKATLIVPWSLSLPSPACRPIGARAAGEGDPAGGKSSATPLPPGAARRCAKLLELPYSVTVDGAPEARQATVEITVIQDADGRPLQVSIGGPDLFLRLEETFTVRAIPPGNRDGRAASVARAIELVRGEFGRAISRDPACKRAPAAPFLLDLGCDGVRATARPAADATEDDVLVIGPL